MPVKTRSDRPDMRTVSKRPSYCCGPTQVGIQIEQDSDGISRNPNDGGLGDGDGVGGEEKKREGSTVWQSPVSPMGASGTALTAEIEGDDDADSGERDPEDQNQRLAPPPRRKLSSWSRAHRRSGDDISRFGGEHGSDGEEETWNVEELDVLSSCSSSHAGSDFASHHGSGSSRHPSGASHGGSTASYCEAQDWSDNEGSHTVHSESHSCHLSSRSSSGW